MKSRKLNIPLLFAALTTLLVTACGGGGGGSSLSSGVSIPTAGVSITQANAEIITAEVLASADIVEGMSVATDILTGVSISVPDNAFNFPDLVLRILEQLPDLNSLSSSASITGVVVSDTVPCDTAGSFTVIADVFNTNVWTAGDTITVTFNDCEELGIVINGTMELTITEATNINIGVPAVTPYSLGVDVIFTSLSMSDGSITLTGNGDMSILLSEDLAGTESLEISGTSFEVSAAGEAERLTEYLYDFVFNVADDYSVDLHGIIASTVISGSVSFVTDTTFTGNDFVFDGNPTAGVLLITTSIDSSQARITAQPDGINVRIEVDNDGDSIYEIDFMTTWTALESL